MPELGLLELFVIGIILFLVVGPERMPQLFGQLGRLSRTARDLLQDAKRMMLDTPTNSIVTPIQSQITAINAEVEQGVKELQQAKIELDHPKQENIKSSP